MYPLPFLKGCSDYTSLHACHPVPPTSVKHSHGHDLPLPPCAFWVYVRAVGRVEHAVSDQATILQSLEALREEEGHLQRSIDWDGAARHTTKASFVPTSHEDQREGLAGKRLEGVVAEGTSLNFDHIFT